MGYRKLSDAYKLGVRKMLDDGCTYQEAAESFGVSRIRVVQLFPGASGRENRTGRSDKLRACNVPAIGGYILKEKMSVRQFAEKCGIPYMTTHRLLFGKDKPNPHARNIEKILRATGMTYEEAFGGERGGQTP
jgi:hypothetical protein